MASFPRQLFMKKKSRFQPNVTKIDDSYWDKISGIGGFSVRFAVFRSRGQRLTTRSRCANCEICSIRTDGKTLSHRSYGAKSAASTPRPTGQRWRGRSRMGHFMPGGAIVSSTYCCLPVSCPQLPATREHNCGWNIPRRPHCTNSGFIPFLEHFP